MFLLWGEEQLDSWKDCGRGVEGFGEGFDV